MDEGAISETELETIRKNLKGFEFQERGLVDTAVVEERENDSTLGSEKLFDVHESQNGETRLIFKEPIFEDEVVNPQRKSSAAEGRELRKV